MAGLLQNPALRMEMINFQLNDDFGPMMEQIIAKIFQKIAFSNFSEYQIQTCEELIELEKVIHKRIGLKVSINTCSYYPAAIIPFHLNDSSIMKDNETIRYNWEMLDQNKFKKMFDGQRGTVDEAKVKLGGLFSEYSNTVFLNFHILGQIGLDPTEVTAVLLHELGHGFYACAYTARSDRSNQIIADALANKAKNPEAFTEIVYTTLKNDGVNVKKEVVEGLTSNNPVVFSQACLSVVSECIMTQMESGKYDETSFEQLADNFAARFGYSEALVTGLEKLHPGGVKGFKSFEGFQWFMTTLHTVLIFVGGIILAWGFFSGAMALTFGGLLITIIMILVGLLMGYAIIITSGEAGKDFTYDDLVKRYNRIRLQLIEMIKNKALTKDQAKEAIKNAEFIAKLIQDLKPYRGPLDYLFNKFNPKDKRAKNSIERQQAIEDLMGNSLFISALKAKLAV